MKIAIPHFQKSKVFALVTLAYTGVFSATQAFAAECKYILYSEWNDGFVAGIEIKNDGDTVLSDWSVNWEYADATIESSWSAELEGSSPYTATHAGWNQYIYPGKSVQFGFVAAKNTAGSSLEIPILKGSCGVKPTPTPTPPPTPGPILCADVWADLTISGLENEDQIYISFYGDWQNGFIGWKGNTFMETMWAGHCGSLSSIPPGGVSLLDSAGYRCNLNDPNSMHIDISCSLETTLPITPTPSPLPTPSI